MRPMDGPTFYTPPKYGKKIQYVIQDSSPNLNPKAIKYIQKVTSKFGNPSCSIDSTMHATCIE